MNLVLVCLVRVLLVSLTLCVCHVLLTAATAVYVYWKRGPNLGKAELTEAFFACLTGRIALLTWPAAYWWLALPMLLIKLIRRK